jgi:hypothetical protein
VSRYDGVCVLHREGANRYEAKFVGELRELGVTPDRSNETARFNEHSVPTPFRPDATCINLSPDFNLVYEIDEKEHRDRIAPNEWHRMHQVTRQLDAIKPAVWIRFNFDRQWIGQTKYLHPVVMKLAFQMLQRRRQSARIGGQHLFVIFVNYSEAAFDRMDEALFQLRAIAQVTDVARLEFNDPLMIEARRQAEQAAAAEIVPEATGLMQNLRANCSIM